VAKALLEIERFGNKPRAVGMRRPARVMTSSVIKSSDFMKESENVSDEGTSRNREDMESISLSPQHLSACRSAV